MILFLYLLIAHIVGDFFFQNERVCKEKRDKGLCSSYMYGHAFVIFLLSALVMFSTKLWIAAMIIGITHLVIDAIKSSFEKKLENKGTEYKNLFSLWLFLFDQCLHVIIILVVSLWVVKSNSWNPPSCLSYISTKHLLVLIAYLICSKPSNVLIKEILDYCQVKTMKGEASDTRKEEATFKSGALIGVFERWIILFFLLVKGYLALGYLITAKSILRFGEGERNERIEYILAGTLVSFAIAITCGLIITVYSDKVYNLLNLFFN